MERNKNADEQWEKKFKTENEHWQQKFDKDNEHWEKTFEEEKRKFEITSKQTQQRINMEAKRLAHQLSNGGGKKNGSKDSNDYVDFATRNGKFISVPKDKLTPSNIRYVFNHLKHDERLQFCERDKDGNYKQPTVDAMLMAIGAYSNRVMIQDALTNLTMEDMPSAPNSTNDWSQYERK